MLGYEATAEEAAGVLSGRIERGAPWKGLHTHMSLNPGTPQKSHGDRPETQ